MKTKWAEQTLASAMDDLVAELTFGDELDQHEEAELTSARNRAAGALGLPAKSLQELKAATRPAPRTPRCTR